LIGGGATVISKCASHASAGSILLFAFLFQGYAKSAETPTAGMDHRFELAISQLEKKTDADSLAAAGLLRAVESKPETAVDFLTRASARAPERADLVWLQIQICQRIASCGPEPAEAQLRTLDPSNGAGWLNALSRAGASKNEAAQLTVLTTLAGTERVDFYWTTLIVHLTEAIAATGEVPQSEALVYVIGVLAAEAMPAYQTISDLCNDDRLKDADVVKDCRAVALAFEHGDTDVTEMVGVTIAKRVWSANTVEWARASEARRIHEYRSALLMHSTFYTLPPARWASKYLALCAKNRREQDVEVGEILEEGKNPDPPPDSAS
jgi:hypothetical protein